MTDASCVTVHTVSSRAADNGISWTGDGCRNWAVVAGGRAGDLWGDR